MNLFRALGLEEQNSSRVSLSSYPIEEGDPDLVLPDLQPSNKKVYQVGSFLPKIDWLSPHHWESLATSKGDQVAKGSTLLCWARDILPLLSYTQGTR